MIKCPQTGGYPPTVLMHGIIRLCGLSSEVIISQIKSAQADTAYAVLLPVAKGFGDKMSSDRRVSANRAYARDNPLMRFIV